MPDPHAQPEIKTPRLRLRPLDIADAPVVQQLAGNVEVARSTLLIPYPYPDGAAEAWISSHGAEWKKRNQVVFGVVHNADDALIGCVGLTRDKADPSSAEMGYWIGHPFWNNGFCTEAARALIDFGFDALDLRRITAHHFADNPASGRVMLKLGMVREGVLPKHVEKWGELKDLVLYGISNPA